MSKSRREIWRCIECKKYRSRNKWRENVFDMPFLSLTPFPIGYLLPDLIELTVIISWQLNKNQDKWSIYFIINHFYLFSMYDIPEHQPYQYIRVCAIKRKKREENKNDRIMHAQDEINVCLGVIRIFICSFVIVFICVILSWWKRLWICLHSIRLSFW